MIPRLEVAVTVVVVLCAASPCHASAAKRRRVLGGARAERFGFRCDPPPLSPMAGSFVDSGGRAGRGREGVSARVGCSKGTFRGGWVLGHRRAPGAGAGA